MPNWCKNKLVVSGDKTKIAELMAQVGLADNPPAIKLHSIVPMPRSLHITKGSSTINGLAALTGEWTDLLSHPGWVRERLIELSCGFLPETREDLIRLLTNEHQQCQ